MTNRYTRSTFCQGWTSEEKKKAVRRLERSVEVSEVNGDSRGRGIYMQEGTGIHELAWFDLGPD